MLIGLNYFNYFSEIEELFVRRRGKNLLLSPLDWALIESWKERGVPLSVALRAIETVFEKAESESARKRSIKSLLYCRDEVERQYENWLAGQTGAEDNSENKAENKTERRQNSEKPANDDIAAPSSQGEIFAHLRLAAENLRRPALNLNHNWQKIAADVLAALDAAQKEFHRTADLEQLEIVLSGLDRRIDAALLESFPIEKKLELEKENAVRLRSYQNRMTETVYRETLRTLLLKSLREQAEIPRFSLFYL